MDYALSREEKNKKVRDSACKGKFQRDAVAAALSLFEAAPSCGC